jgi:hypothetical protein
MSRPTLRRMSSIHHRVVCRPSVPFFFPITGTILVCVARRYRITHWATAMPFSFVFCTLHGAPYPHQRRQLSVVCAWRLHFVIPPHLCVFNATHNSTEGSTASTTCPCRHISHVAALQGGPFLPTVPRCHPVVTAVWHSVTNYHTLNYLMRGGVLTTIPFASEPPVQACRLAKYLTRGVHVLRPV